MYSFDLISFVYIPRSTLRTYRSYAIGQTVGTELLRLILLVVLLFVISFYYLKMSQYPMNTQYFL